MIVKRFSMRIVNPALAGLVGLALCATIATDISDPPPAAHRQTKHVFGPMLDWFRHAIERIEANLPSANPSDGGNGNESAGVNANATDERLAALGLDTTGLREALAFYKAGDLAHGDAEAKNARDPLVKTVLEWTALRVAPREVGFDRLAAFQMAHPDWPANDWIRHRMEASLYFDNASPQRIATFFSTEKPQTVPGKLAFARLLESTGRGAEAGALVRAIWRDADLNFGLENKVKTEFSHYFEKSDYRSRADRLAAKGENAAALRAAAVAGNEVVNLIKLRIAADNETASDKMFAAIPAALQSDPDYLLAKVQKLRHAEKYKDAVAILLKSPDAHLPAALDGDEWWTERRLLARKMLDLGDAETAYKICAAHTAQSNEARMEAEFHAGWIALRFLNDPAKASQHFAILATLAETPISTARAAYWQGRAEEISHDPDALARAKSFYEAAAAESATYYGQLARERLGLTRQISLRTLSDPARGNARIEAVRAVELLFALNEKESAVWLASKIAQNVSDERQLAAASDLVAAEHDAHAALMIGKILNQRRLADDNLAFPTFGIPQFDPLQNSAAPAVVYSVARQESAFEPSAASGAGAKGLMQLIAPTAKRTAEHAGLNFSEDRLVNDAAFNAQLGAAHLGHLLSEQGGSYILTFAAYNAGTKRVKQWIDAYGDPRTPGVDPIDWVERIPFTETRNYVQRVMESLRVYQVSLSEPQPAQTVGQAGSQVRTAAQ